AKPTLLAAGAAGVAGASGLLAAPAASSVGFAVQLGAFGQANDANVLRDKVRAAGFSAFVEQVRTEKGTLHRVRVGPVANRADAEQLKAQVAAKVGVAGMVRPHP
ncbi:SPOR domain-containing protein, partial [uncultured Stenotrophomonas sp.]|uniref:SPOR domain-containing protein n=1 Tax=uncultured Stenotrophomonas sp. TaxID=165438 RepID=UPI0025D39CDB